MIPGSANPLLLADAGYQIQRSLRLRSSASAYLARTPAVAGNRKTWTWSGWVKRGAFVQSHLFSSRTAASPYSQFQFLAADTIQFVDLASAQLVTTQVFRDPSAAYHIILAIDTTQATATNRLKLFVNGTQITAFSTASYPAQNADLNMNMAAAHTIGRLDFGATEYLDGYLSEVNFIDGQALTSASFGEISPTTGQWQAKKYAGSYGTNGFYLPFTDNSAATATAIGADKSGNGNNWTPNNISTTAGSTYDSMLDVPLGAGGAERGNYAVLNPLSKTGQTLANGNLTFSSTAGTAGQASAPTFSVGASGKWYWEAQVTTTPQNQTEECIGIVNDIGTPGSIARAYNSAGQYFDGSSWTAYGAAWAINDIFGIAIDVDNSQITFYKNNVSQGTKTWAWNSAGNCSLRLGSATGTTYQSNFGQRPFAYTPPTGFKTLHTGNLPDPVIKQPAQYMAATTYNGNGTSQNISNAVNGVSFQPDLVWVKSRNTLEAHILIDSVRGVGKELESNLTDAEAYNAQSIQAFNSGGYTSGSSNTNVSGRTYVGWQWKAGGAAVANNAGSIASQVSAGVAQGFSIVTYTGTGANATVGHGLGVAPKMVIGKSTTGVRSWLVWHAALPGTDYLVLNGTNAKATVASVWNSAVPTSSVVSLGSDVTLNTAGAGNILYCFSEVAGYSKFGSYVGNGSADGPFVFCNFAPAFIMLKRTDSTGNWTMYDRARSTRNADTKVLYPNLSNAEDASTDHFDWLSNGFKMKSTNQNTSGGTFIFMAFAEAPQKFSLAR